MPAVDSASSPRVAVVGIGSCTVDYFALVPKLISAEEKINVPSLEVHAGGVTANNLTQVARLGAFKLADVLKPCKAAARDGQAR